MYFMVKRIYSTLERTIIADDSVERHSILNSREMYQKPNKREKSMTIFFLLIFAVIARLLISFENVFCEPSQLSRPIVLMND